MRVPSEFDDKPLAFWQRQEESLPILSKVAEVYLDTSSSSVPDEPVFSTTEIISNGKRSSIGTEKLNRVVFIHDNFSLAVDAGVDPKFSAAAARPALRRPLLRGPPQEPYHRSRPFGPRHLAMRAIELHHTQTYHESHPEPKLY